MIFLRFRERMINHKIYKLITYFSYKLGGVGIRVDPEYGDPRQTALAVFPHPDHPVWSS